MFHATTLAIGGLALAFLLDKLGWEGLRRVFVGTGWWFALVAAIDLGSLLCDAGASHSFVRPHAEVSYWRVFAAQASGLAINRLTPANSMGEAVKVTMLAEHVPTHAAVSAIVMFNLATITIAIAAVVLGVPLTLITLDLSPGVQIAVAIAGVVMVAFVILLLVIARRGAVGSLITALQRLRLISEMRAERWRTKIVDIDAHVKQFGRPGSRRGIGFVMLSRTLNWIGTVITMIAADIPLDPPLVLAMLSVGILITWMSNVIPLGLGIADGTNYALYGVLGSSGPVGLVYTMINRARTCLLAMMGLTVMLIENLTARPSRAD
ncbi:MAG: Membrane protein [Myxococcales bacterium]|nr:Membrane protein [Myxococcales bacterium]